MVASKNAHFHNAILLANSTTYHNTQINDPSTLKPKVSIAANHGSACFRLAALNGLCTKENTAWLGLLLLESENNNKDKACYL